MDKDKARNLLIEILNDANSLQLEDTSALDALERRLKLVIIKLFGSSSDYIKDLVSVQRYFFYTFDSPDLWKKGVDTFKNLVNTIIKDVEIEADLPIKLKYTPSNSTIKSKKIFVVHGHDDAMKQSVARTIEKLGFEPIILHDKPDKGRTIIEKFSDYSNVGFAVVLLSPDDLAYSKSEKPKDARYRARQNVILELGFFLGKLGRGRVIVLHKEIEDFEMPSDYSGVLYTPFDSKGAWQLNLVKELKASGYEADANKL